MSTTNHTPTPWYVETTAVYDAKNLLVTDTCFTGGRPGPNRANAAHIVKCVNAHDELVAALRSVITAADEVGPKTWSMAVAEVRAALSKVQS